MICNNFRSESSKYKLLNIDLDSDYNSKMLTSTPSPMLSDFSSSTRGSNGQKLIKRPSIDSGIHMSCGPASESFRPKSSKVYTMRENPKLSKWVPLPFEIFSFFRNYRQFWHLDVIWQFWPFQHFGHFWHFWHFHFRFDRSMSLPVQSSSLRDHSDSETMDYHKKMDFALCK